jgi:hypothetical protein
MLIQKEQADRPNLYIVYILILAAIPPVAIYIGSTMTGWRIGEGDITRMTASSTLSLCVLIYLAIIAEIYVLGRAIDWMRATYTDLSKRELSGLALATYLVMPLLVFSVFAVYPTIWIIILTMIVASSYSAYLLFAGVPIVFNIPKERGFMFSGAILTIALVLAVVLLISMVIVWVMGFSPEFTN